MTKRISSPKTVQDGVDSSIAVIDDFETLMLIYKDEKRRQCQCARVAKSRSKKKKQLEKLVDERSRLEHQVKLHEAVVRKKAASSGQSDQSSNCSIMASLRELVVERELLWTQNVALRREIGRHQTVRSLLKSSHNEFQEGEKMRGLSLNDGQAGWWVHLRNGEPSFYYIPFSRAEFDAFPSPFEPGFAADTPCNMFVGTFLGWNAYRASISPEKPLSIRTRFTKRVLCSIDTLLKTTMAKVNEVTPLLVTPIGWGYSQHSTVTTQVLQELDQDSRVMFQNIPGQKILRYVFLQRTGQWELQDGKRKMAFSMVMIDSKATCCEGMEDLQSDVEWLTEGGSYLSMTEIDDRTTDVLYEQWADCQSEQHREHLMIQWTHTAVRWEQAIVPPNLISCNA